MCIFTYGVAMNGDTTVGINTIVELWRDTLEAERLGLEWAEHRV